MSRVFLRPELGPAQPGAVVPPILEHNSPNQGLPCKRAPVGGVRALSGLATGSRSGTRIPCGSGQGMRALAESWEIHGTLGWAGGRAGWRRRAPWPAGQEDLGAGPGWPGPGQPASTSIEPGQCAQVIDAH